MVLREARAPSWRQVGVGKGALALASPSRSGPEQVRCLVQIPSLQGSRSGAIHPVRVCRRWAPAGLLLRDLMAPAVREPPRRESDDPRGGPEGESRCACW